MSFRFTFQKALAALLAVTFLADLYAACPDKAADPLVYCQNTEKYCSLEVLHHINCVSNENPTGAFTNNCFQNKETRYQGPFDTMTSLGSKVKPGPQIRCVEDCPCVKVPYPNPCFNTCESSSDPRLCQNRTGDTVVQDGGCFGT